jgi:hypothetical protein
MTAIVVTAAAAPTTLLFPIIFSTRNLASSADNEVGDAVDEVEILVAAKTPLMGWGSNSFRRRENGSDDEGDRCGNIPTDFKAMIGPENNRRRMLQEQPMIVRLR